MPTQPSALLAENGGAIEGDFFPNIAAADALARIDAYLVAGRASAVAAGLTDPEPAAIAWAYHCVFRAVYLRLSANPATVQLGEVGQRSYLVTQIANFKDEADKYLAEYTVALASAAPVAEPATFRVISSFRAPTV